MFDEVALLGIADACLIVATFTYGAYVVYGRKDMARVAAVTVLAAAALLLAGLLWRGVREGRLPFTGPYDLYIALAFATVASYLLVQWLTGEVGSCGGAGTGLIASLLTSFALLAVPPSARQPTTLSPVFASPWLTVHLITLMCAYGLLSTGAGYGLMALWPEKLTSLAMPRSVREGQRLALALGLVILSASLCAGGAWAWNTWGRYQAPFAASSWNLIVWLIYAALQIRMSVLTRITRASIFLPTLGYSSVVIAMWTLALM
jgi:ABC-type transport system involved in cytochrome c biogenesis permease subunit